MVDKFLQDIKRQYAVNIELDKKSDESYFATIRAKTAKYPHLDIHYINGVIYSVTFLNNEFFEIPRQHLEQVVVSILDASYKVQKPFLAKQSIRIEQSDGSFIVPERVYKLDQAMKDFYSSMPHKFPKNK